MGPFGAAVCATALLFVSLSSGCTDVHSCFQREVTFGVDRMQVEQQPDPGMLQEEVDLEELLDPKEFPPIEQKIVFPPIIPGRGVLTPRGRRPSFRFQQLYPVQFPLGQPTPDNIQAICLHGDHRPRYPDSYFPPSGFSKQKRKAAAVNNAESWFSTCCKGNETWGEDGTLCCATQAWKRSVDLFCEEDSSVKDHQDECCRLKDNNRLNCFSEDSLNPSYEPTEEQPVQPLRSAANFFFDSNTCPRNLMTLLSPRASRGTTETNSSTPHNLNINFPPGRPTAENIRSLCENQKLRPLYTTKCLPRSGHELLARQVKTINRLEKGFKRCCKQKKGMLSCADQKWREEVNKYCSSRKGEQVDFQCCLNENADNQHSCFQSASPDPHYNLIAAPEENSPNPLCDTRNVKKASLPVGFKRIFVKQCCPLPEENKNNCLEEMSQNMCLSKKTSTPISRLCCKMPSREEVSACAFKMITDAISRATQSKGQKKRKVCPIP